MLSPRVASLQVKASSGLYVSGSTKDRAERIDLHNGRTLPGSFMWFDVVIRKGDSAQDSDIQSAV